MAPRKCSAQVMLEYLVMAVIVMAAIIYGGPFLVNSIGAHFRIVEDNAGDAFSEKPKQAAPLVCACNPSTSNPSTWPVVGQCKEQGCGVLETMRRRACPGCDPDEQKACAQDRKCCIYPAVKGACGSLDPSLEDTLCVSRELAINSDTGGVQNGRCLDSKGGVHGCLSNEISSSVTCGEGVTVFLCTPDSSCVPDCTSEIWTPDASTGCVGTDVDQKGNCGDERTVPGTKLPACPPATEVSCGQEIASTNECEGCSGTGTEGANCPPGYECKDGGCKLICHDQSSGIYMAAHYYSATHCGHTPSCNTSNAPEAKWISVSQKGGKCGFSKWRHRQCGTLYKHAGRICHADPCVRGMEAVGPTEVVFHLGKYNAVSRTCDFSENLKTTVKRSGSKFNSNTWVCDFCSNCNTNCDAGFAFAGDNNGYGNNGAVASWGQ